MNEQMLLDRMSQMIRLGFVNARQPEKMRVKVTLPDTPGQPLVTDWLPVLCPRACGDLQFDLPDIGDQVLCLFLAYGLEQGFVIGSMYGRQTPPVQSGDKWHRTFSDGATLEYDRASHSLTADIPGTASIKCSQSITLEAPIIYLRGTLVNTAKDGNPGVANFSGGMTIQNGGLNVASGDVVASGVSLVSHTTEGVESGDGTSSHPSGGSASSPGTAAIAVPVAGTLAYADWVARNLDALAERVEKKGAYPDQTIICLPDIAQNMMELAENELERECWRLLKVFLEYWLAGNANDDPKKNTTPMFVDWDKLKESKIIQHGLYKLKTDFITTKLKEQLTRKLQSGNYFTDRKKDFDFINYNVEGWDDESNWQIWDENFSQHYAIDMFDYAMNPAEMESLYVAMGKFSLRAMVKGYTQPVSPPKYKVCITEIAVYIYDTFNFEGLSPLGCWNCEELKFTGLDSEDGVPLGNWDIRLFRERHGNGNDFRIFSKPLLIDDFERCCYDVSI